MKKLIEIIDGKVFINSITLPYLKRKKSKRYYFIFAFILFFIGQ